MPAPFYVNMAVAPFFQADAQPLAKAICGAALEENPYSGHLELMSNKDEENQPRTGGGTKLADESTKQDPPRYASYMHDFDDDTEDAITLPKVKPEVTDDDADKKKADSAFDDVEIQIDEDDLIAESESQPPGRKY